MSEIVRALKISFYNTRECIAGIGFLEDRYNRFKRILIITKNGRNVSKLPKKLSKSKHLSRALKEKRALRNKNKYIGIVPELEGPQLGL